MSYSGSKSGFTFIELAVVIAMMSILTGIATLSLTSLQNNTNLTTSINTLVSDARQQQLKAMQGETEGRLSSANYGIHFTSNSYVLFHGTYSSVDPTNFVINLDSNETFSSITFPSSEVIFTQVTGEVSGFVNGSNTVTLKNTTINSQKVITINRYGVITQVN